MLENNQLKEISKQCLEGWDLYKDSHKISVKEISEGKIWIGYSDNVKMPAIAGASWETTHFHVNIIDGVLYVLSIGVSEENRGKGHGDKLYQILEHIAKDAGCKKVQMTASGRTKTGESRKDYLLRRGYKELGNEVYKDV